MQSNEIVEHINTIGESVPIEDGFHPVFWSVMAFNLIVFALVRSLNPGYLQTLFGTAFNNRQLVNNIRENLNLNRPTSILLNLTYFTSLAAIIWRLMKTNQDYFILVFLAAIIVLSFIKLILIRTVSFLINVKIGLYEHILNHLIFFQIAGIILTPILIFTHYVPASYVNSVLIFLLFIVALFVITREIQSLARAVQYKISIFYIILYLCTLELLPLVVGIRVFILNSEVLN